MKFNVVILNPPYSAGETLREGSNRRKAGGFLARKFVEFALSVARDRVIAICPVGQMQPKKTAFREQGLYRIVGSIKHFPGVRLKEIGTYYFDKQTIQPMYDETSAPSYTYSLDSIFSLKSTIQMSRNLLEPQLNTEGAHKVFVTASKPMYTDNAQLIQELNDVSRGHWRAVINHNGDPNGMSYISLASPTDTILSGNCHYFVLPNAEAFEPLRAYLATQELKEHAKRYKLTATNSRAFMKTIKLPDYFIEELQTNAEYQLAVNSLVVA